MPVCGLCGTKDTVRKETEEVSRTIPLACSYDEGVKNRQERAIEGMTGEGNGGRKGWKMKENNEKEKE